MKGGLLFDLRRLHLAVEQASRPQLEPLGLTSAQAVVLGWLLESGHGEVCASHLHRQTGLSRAAISATLKHLQRGGYLEVAACPGDERKKRIVLTRKARELQAALASCAAQQQEHMCAGLTAQQLRTFAECLRRMQQNLGQTRAGPAPGTRRNQ